ncbi:hypothetical protein [Deinococcus sonorensis]|uniref:Lipoprotein n=2 Tax=Deinococcus sonorensis TaxID=309891 RepID=A0AAU7U6H4_9DEIO
MPILKPLVLTALLAMTACGAGSAPTPSSPSGSGTPPTQSGGGTPPSTSGGGTPSTPPGPGTPSTPPGSGPCPPAGPIAAPAAGPLDAALFGVWTDVTDKLELAFLPDGRAFMLDTRPGTKVGAQPGTWQVRQGKLDFHWLISGPDRESYGVSGNGMTVAGWIEMNRTGSAGDAPGEYARQTAAAAADAQTWQARYPVGPIVASNAKNDPQPGRVCAGATVYSGEGLDVEDMTILTAYYTDPYQVVHEYKTGQAVEFNFLPNGRFWHNSWLAKGVDANFQPVHELITVWGRYRVQPGPALEGDTVTLEYDGGTTETVKVLGGRRYLYQPGSDILYLNQHPKPTPGG